ncbi:MAG: ribonuclease [Sphingomonas bacterium]|uniref:reverse transcriptase-like protein n=1 Tax=Sphingomonas bacterium TaxID=1895847 RepID=UPI00261ABD26|nr:reverse transcriptase-like protein [Sphingomonas bacterium]MDB5694613.1 ribonuclease [Sphingomonas bacterium]
MRTRLKVYFDGGYRGNAMETAVVAAGQVTIARGLGPGSSSDAEWLALIRALTIAQSLGSDFVLLGDSADVVAKANGLIRCRGSCVGHLREFRTLAGGRDAPHIRYIKRSQNLAGIALARQHPR